MVWPYGKSFWPPGFYLFGLPVSALRPYIVCRTYMQPKNQTKIYCAGLKRF